MNFRRYGCFAVAMTALLLAGLTLIVFPVIGSPRMVTIPERHITNLPCSLLAEGCQP